MITNSYNDLCREIQLLELRVGDLKREYNFYADFLNSKPSGIRTSQIGHDKVQSSNPYMAPEEAYKKCVEINDLLMQYDKLITDKINVKNEMEKCMSEFDTLEGKINYYFHIKDMKLYEIADELGYSYEWIREVKSKHDKKQKKNTPQYTHKI